MARIILLLLAFSCIADAVSTAAEARARSWLHVRRDAPETDELADLKSSDPNSYSIVKALLTKQKLGLLDPRHPMASFGAPKDSDDQGEHLVGAAAFAKFATPSDQVHQSASTSEEGTSTPEVYPGVGTGHGDMFNWKPPNSAMDDQMVQNVLGSTSALTSGTDSSSNFLSKIGDSSQEAVVVQPAPQQIETPVAPPVVEAKPAPVESQAASQDNAYLTGIDFGSRAKQEVESDPAPAAPTAPAAAANPYLSGIDFSSDTPTPVVKKHQHVDLSTNALDGFNWDGADKEKPVASAAEEASVVTMQAPAPVEATPVAAKASDALSKWLGGAAMLQQQAAAPTPKAVHNYYELDLQ